MALENILKKIKEEAETEAKKILSEADAEAGVIKKDGEARLSQLDAVFERDKAAIDMELKNAILLPAKLEVRGLKLSKKQELINRIFAEAFEFNEAEYKKVLSYLFSQVEGVKEGTIFPAAGKEEITKAFLKERNANAKIGDSVNGIMGGFLMKAGKIEYDCSFKTLMQKLKEKLETEVAPSFAN